MGLKDKVVMVTGGASGVGEAFARLFLTQGSKVFICDIDEASGKLTLKALQDEYGVDKVLFSKCDVSNDQSIEDAYNECEAKLGTIYILVNNAGTMSNDWKRVIDVNYGGVVRGTELAIRRMGKHNGGKGGHVINISSVAAVQAYLAFPFYSASKAAVAHYTRCAGDEFHQNYTGVSIQCICPNAIDTPFLEITRKAAYTPQCDHIVQDIIDNTPRLLAKEVAEAGLKLLRDKKPGAALIVEAGKEPRYYIPPIV